MPGVPFNTARGAASSLQMAPPFAFSDVTMSVFPLRASLPTLQNFCRNYLNQAPDIVQFQPFVPFVYLVILDYGRMSQEAANMGWVSQREVAFGIPLRWLNAGPHGLAFHDWAFSSPFIFVDNELSMSTGREVYGWPKLLARLDPSVSEWARGPHDARRVFQVSTKGAGKAYAGETSKYRPLLDVVQHRPAGLFDIPPNLDAIVRPLSQLPNAAAGMARLGADLTKTFLGMASDRITGSAVLPDLTDMGAIRAQLAPEIRQSWRNAKAWVPGIKDTLWSLFPRMYANTINFKQFRDAASPDATCYQALTAARMPVTSVKKGGFLGPENMLLGQLDGGYRIDIHKVAGLPIVESLGLEVAEECEIDGTLVSSLAPVSPLWMQVDMTYGTASTLAWRGRSGDWNEGAHLVGLKDKEATRRAQHTAPERPATPKPEGKPVEPAKMAPAREPLFDWPEALDDGQSFDYIRAMNFFNTARGASEAIGGSFLVPDASLRILPLKADKEKLQQFVREYLRVENCMRFEAWGDFAYLVVSDFKQMNSELNPIAKRRARELSLLVPVKCYEWFKDGDFPEDHDGLDGDTRRARGREKLLTTGFVNAFTYVDDVETAITANEVFGVPSMGSSIVSRENDWLSRDFGADAHQQGLLRMNAQVLPDLMVGAEAVERTLVDILAHHPRRADVHETENKSVNRWVGLLADDLEAKFTEDRTIDAACDDDAGMKAGQESIHAAQGFALKLIGGELPLNQFSLKQFRDCEHTQKACYQGVVLRRHQIMKLGDFREIDTPLHVSITDYPTQPITEILGLKPKFSYPGRDRIVRVFEAVRPFSLNADVRRGAGVTLFERVGVEAWNRVDITEEIFGWCKVESDQISAIIQSLGKGDTVALTYEYRLPKTGVIIEKRLRKVNARFLKSWYENRVQKDRVRNIMVKQRDRDDVVSVISDADVLREYTPEKGLDLAAWNTQMRAQESLFRQSQLAEAMEYFSPATILDKVLSRRWGRTNGPTIPRFNKPDFCVPVTSVPKHFAPVLFPLNERHEGYWPQTRAQFDFDRAKRESEATAFRFEFNSAIRILALLYPSALGHAQAEGEQPEPGFGTAITALSQTLLRYMDEGQRQAAQKKARRAIERIKGVEDIDGMMRASEEIVVQFIDAHLPDTFKITDDDMRQSVIERLRDQSAQLIPAVEWRAVYDALIIVRDKIKNSLGPNARHEKEILDRLASFIARAKDNWLDMQQLEASRDDIKGRYPDPVTRPHTDLRNRLHKVMTQGMPKD